MYLALRLIIAIVALFKVVAASAAEPVSFTRDILPILSDACFHCHGPDEQARQAELRFDQEESVFALRGGHAAVVPGKPESSHMVERIVSTDADLQMPPPTAARKLRSPEIELLQRWVTEGAQWGRHWAFEPMARPTPPAPSTSWPRNAIDQFIEKPIHKAGLAPAQPAERDLLLRRLSFDLTGLPPTVEEISHFVNDTSPQALETVVDRLLASTAYGERMAADWMDVARFADTHGYQADRFRPMTAWRDWVINAFNRNQPFDEFVTWQLAGDLLPNATQEQRLATAFNRLHLQNEEGGVVEEEFRVAYVTDRVNTFGTAFLGMTFECCRCHDHKYDPLTQKDFYSLFSFFQNIDESGQTTYFTGAMPVPTLLLTTNEQERELAALHTTAKQAQAAVQAMSTLLDSEVEAWWNAADHTAAAPALALPRQYYTFDSWVDRKVASTVPEGPVLNEVETQERIPGKVGDGARLDGDGGFSAASWTAASRADSFSISIWVSPRQHAARQVVLHWSKAPIDAGSRGYELLLEEGRPAFGLHHMWPGNSLKVKSAVPVPIDQWTHLSVTYDGSSRASGVTVYQNGQPVECEVVRDKLVKDIGYSDVPPLQIGYRFRDNGFKGGGVDELRFDDRVLTSLEVAEIAGLPTRQESWTKRWSELNASERAAWHTEFLRTREPYQAAIKHLHEARMAETKAIEPVPEVMAMVELPTPKPAYLLKRGSYDSLGDAVTADTPQVLPAFDAKLPRNRLGLARWLLHPEHPLMARVTVNRLWQQMFGRGLVETSDNFGTTGAQPTHPELLDWFARDFATHGWDVKRALKQIALSSTYQQSSRSRAAIEADPDNRLLARASARRLTAEMLRDQALATAGLLTRQLGGASVLPYQPDGLWSVATNGASYPQSHGPDLYRRALYTYWKRTIPPVTPILFDAAERNVCIVRRQSTSTPLQALALLNDVQFVEAARLLGDRLLAHPAPDMGEKLAWAFHAVTSRPPRPDELELLAETYRDQRQHFENDPLAAEKLLQAGETRSATQRDALDQAAATTVCQLLLSLDAALMLR